jgi:hypothetical protein
MSEEELTQVRTYLYQTFGIASDYSNGKIRIIYSYKWDTSSGTEREVAKFKELSDKQIKDMKRGLKKILGLYKLENIMTIDGWPFSEYIIDIVKL